MTWSFAWQLARSTEIFDRLPVFTGTPDNRIELNSIIIVYNQLCRMRGFLVGATTDLVQMKTSTNQSMI